MMMNPRLRTALLLGLLPALTALIVALPWFADGDSANWRGDFTQYAARHEHFRNAVLEHGEFPERSHLLGGGYPIIGDPEDPSMSPLVLLTLCCGTITGLKLIVLLCMLASALGTTLLLRAVLRTRPAAAVLGGMLAAALPWIPYRFTDGNPNEALVGFLPLALACLGLSLRCRVWTVALAAVLYVVLVDGKQIFVVLMALLGIVAVLRALPDELGVPARFALLLRRLLQALALALLVALPRLMPALELIAQRGGLARMELHFHAAEYSAATIHAFTPSRLAGDLLLLREAHAGDLVSAGFGLVPLCFVALAVLLAWRRSCAFAVLALLAAWLALAHRAPFDIFAPLWQLPLLNAVDAPDKYFGGPLLLLLVILAGLGVDALCSFVAQRGSWQRWQRVGVGVLCAAALASIAHLCVHSRGITAQAFSKPLPEVALQAQPFHQVKSAGLWRGRFEPLAANTWVNVQRGVGTIDWYTGIPLPECAIARDIVQADGTLERNPAWQGEAWFVDGGRVLEAELTYQHIRVRSDGRGGLLLVNQNFHADWTARGLVVEDHAGLLAVRVPPGVELVELDYSSRALRHGMGMCCAGFMLLGVLLVLERRSGSSGGFARALMR